MASNAAKHRKHEKTMTALALKYPGAYEEFPWGEKVIKVNGKIFLFIAVEAYEDKIPVGLRVTMKLPESRGDALDCPFAKPTGYGLGKSGWVSARFTEKQDVPLDLLISWMDESYRAIAPKKLVKELTSSTRSRSPGSRARKVRKK